MGVTSIRNKSEGRDFVFKYERGIQLTVKGHRSPYTDGSRRVFKREIRRSRRRESAREIRNWL